MQEEAFVKSQLVAFCKALSKVESPLKQKHVRALVVGTHKLRSSRIFWHAVSRIQLEKNPVLTWKFCQLLHKLIHDGHRKVTEESATHIPRLAQLGSFWQHLRSSGYGQANTSYCKMLVSRLNFHKKYPSMPGNFSINARQTEALTSDVNETYELAIDMLDQMDELLNLKASIISVMDSLRWSSLVPQGQCLLAPLILIILDTSKLYDFLVKALFKLHANLPADTLIGHRERFYDIFRRTKKFYEEAANLQYFKYLVQIPTLPTIAPNFQKAHELEEYQAPQAYLHSVATSESGDQSPTDAQSVCDEQISTIIDLSMPQMDGNALMADFSSSAGPSTSQHQQQQQTPQLFDPKDEIIARLRHDIDMERETKERLIQEASIRIEQYETRLVQMKQEIDLNKQTADERGEELNELRTKLSNGNRTEQQGTEAGEGQAAEEAERHRRELEQKLAKLKGLYQQLREDHIKALTEIRDLRTKIDSDGGEKRKTDEEMVNTKQQLKQAEQERAFFESQAKLVQENIQNSAQTIHEAQSKIEHLEGQIEEINETMAGERAKVEQLAKANKMTVEQLMQTFRECLCSAAFSILEQCLEDLQNASSISYPIQLTVPSLRAVIDHLDSVTISPSSADQSVDDHLLASSVFDQFKSFFLLSHRLSDVLTNCASAAYTVSIQRFEEVNEQCRRVQAEAVHFYKDSLQQSDGKERLRTELGRLEALVGALPSEAGAGGGDIDVEMVGRQLDEEMGRMGKAIATAVEHIGELQKRSRETNSGMRLEVNDKILDSCDGLMNAVRELVIRSKEVQEEIVAQGKGATTPSEFYKKNHLWTEGLISAGRVVGVAATELVKSADSFIMGKGGKFEHLIVAAGSVAASVAQLFVSSRVKAVKGSERLSELGKASKAVNLRTAALVGTVKSGQQSLAEEQLLDFSNLSLHETKKEEMESQVRVLELEAELTRERLRFGQLRKQHFHLASLVSNEQQSKENGKEAAD